MTQLSALWSRPSASMSSSAGRPLPVSAAFMSLEKSPPPTPGTADVLAESIARPLRPQSASSTVGRLPPKAEVTDGQFERVVGPSVGGTRGGWAPNDGKASNIDDMCIQGRSMGAGESLQQ